MKHRFITLLTVAAMALTAAPMLNGQACQSWAMRGQYAAMTESFYHMETPLPNLIPANGLQLLTLDHQGNSTSAGAYQFPIASGMTLPLTLRGTLDVNTDCTATWEQYATMMDEEFKWEQNKCVVLDQGNVIRCLSTLSGATSRTLAKRIETPGSCGAGMLQGRFALTCNSWTTMEKPEDLSTPIDDLAVVTLNRDGSGTGSLTSNWISDVREVAVGGNVDVNADCTMDWQLVSEEGLRRTGTGVVVSANEIWLMLTGEGPAGTCVGRRIE